MGKKTWAWVFVQAFMSLETTTCFRPSFRRSIFGILSMSGGVDFDFFGLGTQICEAPLQEATEHSSVYIYLEPFDDR